MRHIKFGEGDYDTTEKLLRQLLTEAKPGVSLPGPTDLPDTAPKADSGVTPETYFGAARATSFTGKPALQTGKTQKFVMPGSQKTNTYTLSGSWKVGDQSLTATKDSKLRLAYKAKNVYMVMSGNGSVTVSAPGEAG